MKGFNAFAGVILGCFGLYYIGASAYNRFFARGVVRIPEPFPWSDGP